MYYTIQYDHKYNNMYEITIDVKEDDIIIVHGRTAICVPELEDGKTIEDHIKDYAENTFLVNLRNNTTKLKNLVLPCDDTSSQGKQ